MISAAERQPNILFIYADDLGYEALNCYGGLDFQTPRLNRMAAAGIRFSRAYASPVCTPSRVSMHTSRYVPRHGHSGVLPVHLGTDKIVDFKKMPTFAQLMRTNGYATSTTGKWQLATLEVWPDHIRDSGFDSWCIWQIWRQGRKTLRHWTPTFNHDGRVRDDIADRFGPDVLVEYVIDQMTAAKAADKPFLIVHNELLPHDPIIPTPAERISGKPASLGRMIHYMDKLVGQLLDAVETLGLRDHTYVIFMGDNGTHEEDFRNPKAGQPDELKHTRHTKAGRVNGGKRKLGDAGTHVPLIVWGPKGIPAGTVCNDLIDIVDIFPTFCELGRTGVPNKLKLDGHSFAPQIHGQPARHTRKWVHHAIGGKGDLRGVGMFDGQWRYFKSGNRLWDARNLPAEPIADETEPDARSAKRKFIRLVETIGPPARNPQTPSRRR